MKAGILHHINATEQIALGAFLAQLQRQYGDQVQHVILFGSQARGDPGPEADVDILIVLDDDDGQLRDRIIDLAFDLFLDHTVLLSPKVIGQSYYDFIAHRRTPFYQNVHRDGIELWTKAQ